MNDFTKTPEQIFGRLFKKSAYGVFVIIAIAVSYYWVSYQKEQSKKEIEQKIDNIFKGKSQLTDCDYTDVDGELNTADDKTPLDNNKEMLVDYYTCSSGGFGVKTLTDLSQAEGTNKEYSIETYESIDMGFKVPDSIYEPGETYFLFQAPGHYKTRGSVKDAYKSAMNYLAYEEKDKNYTFGSFYAISNFKNISNDYYKISRNYTSASNQDLYTEGEVYTSNWIVWYKHNKLIYEIQEKEDVFIFKVVIFSVVIFIVLIILYNMFKQKE